MSMIFNKKFVWIVSSLPNNALIVVQQWYVHGGFPFNSFLGEHRYCRECFPALFGNPSLSHHRFRFTFHALWVLKTLCNWTVHYMDWHILHFSALVVRTDPDGYIKTIAGALRFFNCPMSNFLFPFHKNGYPYSMCQAKIPIISLEL